MKKKKEKRDKKDTRSASAPKRGEYKCGKCGFFPKKTKHNCDEFKASGGKSAGVGAVAPEEAPAQKRAKSATPAAGSPRVAEPEPELESEAEMGDEGDSDQPSLLLKFDALNGWLKRPDRQGVH